METRAVDPATPDGQGHAELAYARQSTDDAGQRPRGDADPASPPATAPERPRGDADPASTRAPGVIAPEDRVILIEPSSGRRWLVVAARGAVKDRGLGVHDPGRLIGQPWGARVDVAGKHLVALPPDLGDILATLRRKAAIILPKDAARIVHELAVAPGDRVFESGIGSGATTAALAWAVGPTGRVVVQELRRDFSQWAMENLERAGLAVRVAVHEGDLTDALAPGVAGPFTAALLDQPEPWKAIPHVLPVLSPGARVACYCPQVSQMEQTARAMQAAGMAEIRCIETIERAWEVKDLGSRPAHDGLMHTAFLVFGRHMGPA